MSLTAGTRLGPYEIQPFLGAGGMGEVHICSLYDGGREGDTDFLVMENVAGETLAECLREGPLPLEQAFTVATEIAVALAVAHRQVVIRLSALTTVFRIPRVRLQPF